MYATVVFTLVFELSFSLLQYYRDIILFTHKNMKIILKSTVDYFQLHFYTFEKLLINSNWREIIHKVSKYMPNGDPSKSCAITMSRLSVS